MSSKMVGIALTVRGVSPRAKLVLIAIADAADVHGVGYPSRTTLAEGADCSKDTVDRCIRELVDAGLLKVTKRHDEERANRQTSNLYTLLFTPAADMRPGGAESDADAAGGAADMPTPQPHSYAAPGAASGAAPNMNGSRNGVDVAAAAGARAIDAIVAAANHPGLDPSKSPDLILTATEVSRWLRNGADLERDVIPTVVAVMAKRPPGSGPIRKWGYFTDAVRETTARNTAPDQPIQPAIRTEHAPHEINLPDSQRRTGKAHAADVYGILAERARRAVT